MIAEKKDYNEIIQYLEKNIQDCIYMYIDIKKYCLNSSEIKVWIDRNNEGAINLVVMKYHTSLSLYSDVDSWSIQLVCDLVSEFRPSSITAKRAIIEKLQYVTHDYKVEYGFVFELKQFSDFGGYEMIEEAAESDMMDIAKLVTADHDIGSYYEIVDYANQLLTRKQTGMGRNYVIRDNGKIIGHIATYAELGDICTTGGLIVDSNYEGKMLGAVLEGYLVNELISENKTVFTFVTSKKRYKLLKNMGNMPTGEYGKMIKQEERDESIRVSV